MITKRIPNLAIGLTCVLTASVFAQAPSVKGLSERITDRIMVTTLSAVQIDSFINAFQADHPDMGIEVIESIPGRTTYLLELVLPPGAAENDDEMDALELDLELDYVDLVLEAEFVYSNEGPEGTTGSTFVDGIVSHSDFVQQFSHNLLQLSNAHLRSTGRSVVIALLDTGIDTTHTQFQGRLSSLRYNAMNNSTDVADVGDGLDSDADGEIDELTGHGTFVAGLISLVSPDATIMPVRVLDGDGCGNHWWFAKGMFFAIDHGVEVINLSLSSTYQSNVVERAIDEAKAKGIVVVAAAGNLNRNIPREYPAMTTDAFGVTATNDMDIKASFSNYHERIFISAPGSNGPVKPGAAGTIDPSRAVISALPGGSYGVWDGTSMAVPFVAGAVALIRSQHPEWAASELTFEKIENLLIDGSVDISAVNPGFNNQLGVGRLNAGASVGFGPPTPQFADLNADGAVDVIDLQAMLTDWGLIHSSADLNGNGQVGISDLLLLLANWQ